MLFSNFPLENVRYVHVDDKKCDDYAHHRGAMFADVKIKDKTVRTLLCHLKHDPEAARLRELDILLPSVEKAANVISLGDFNDFSPAGGYDDNYERVVEEFMAGSDDRHSYLLSRLQQARASDFAAIRRMLERYRDAHPGYVRTHPTMIDLLESRRPREKLDYIFASPHLRLSNPQV